MNDVPSPAAALRWRPPLGQPATLEALERFVREVALDLDPGSRYVRELLDVLAACERLEDYVAHLQDRERAEDFRRDGSVASQGERGFSWVDEAVWGRMDLFERTLANLLTGETRMMWAGEGAQELARFADAAREVGWEGRVEVASIPCSTGKEPFSLAAAALMAGLDVRVVGVDRQEAYLERARSGQLVPHLRDWEHPQAHAYLERDPDGATRVRPQVLERCTFVQGDVLTGELPAGPFHLVSCRNLLGYFRGDSLETAWRNVAGRVRPGGLLLLDRFVTGAAEMAAVPRLLAEHGFTRLFDDASYYRAAADWSG